MAGHSPKLVADLEYVFANFPDPVKLPLLALRELVFETAFENSEIGTVEETLKWGEPAYLTKAGSTLRMGAKQSDPDHYRLFFHCQTTLVDSFRELYPDQFVYEGNRAIVFHRQDVLPRAALAHCILLTLTYHNRKHLPLLGG